MLNRNPAAGHLKIPILTGNRHSPRFHVHASSYRILYVYILNSMFCFIRSVRLCLPTLKFHLKCVQAPARIVLRSAGTVRVRRASNLMKVHIKYKMDWMIFIFKLFSIHINIRFLPPALFHNYYGQNAAVEQKTRRVKKEVAYRPERRRRSSEAASGGCRDEEGNAVCGNRVTRSFEADNIDLLLFGQLKMAIDL